MFAPCCASPLVQRQFVTHRAGKYGADFITAYNGNQMDCSVDIRPPILK